MNCPSPARTILIVDDQAAIRTTLEFVFGITGFAVLSADSGYAAVALAESHKVDGVLIDVHMPGMSGFETFSRLKELPYFQAVRPRVWFMTGAKNEAVERRGKDLGACGLFTKPFDHVELLACIQRGLSGPE